MKKILLLLVLIGQTVFGQVSNYNFTSFDGVYTPLSGGTVFQSGAQCNIDDSVEIALPFAFTIDGVAYTFVRVYSNGFVTFGRGIDNGQIMNANVKYPISNTVMGWSNNIVAAVFGGNLGASAFGNPEIRYGSNSRGDFVVQWQDLSIVGFSLTRATFQLVLKSDGFTIQYVYGPNNTGQASSSAGNIINPQVGLRGNFTKPKENPECNCYRYPDFRTVSVFNGYKWANNTKGNLSSSTFSYCCTQNFSSSGFTIQAVPLSNRRQ